MERSGRFAVIRSTYEFIGPVLVLVVLWEGIARSGLVHTILVPPFSEVVATALYYLSPAGDYLLWKHIGLSLYRLVAGYGLAALFSVTLGAMMGMFRSVYKFFTPILSILIPIPSLAWVPIVIIWLGLGNATPIFIVFLTATFPILYNTSTGVRSIDHKMVWAVRSMGASRSQVFWHVILPGALVHIISGLKIGLASAWRALVAAEMLSAAVYGLGFMIFEAREFLQVPVMYAGIISLAVIGFILENATFGTLESATLKRWGLLRDVH